jgi:hypothetical protein
MYEQLAQEHHALEIAIAQIAERQVIAEQTIAAIAARQAALLTYEPPPQPTG